jgi:hypothetical protein
MTTTRDLRAFSALLRRLQRINVPVSLSLVDDEDSVCGCGKVGRLANGPRRDRPII